MPKQNPKNKPKKKKKPKKTLKEGHMGPSAIKKAVYEELVCRKITRGIYTPFCTLFNRDQTPRSVTQIEAIKTACKEYASENSLNVCVTETGDNVSFEFKIDKH